MPASGLQTRPTVEQEMSRFKGFSSNNGETITPETPEDLNPVAGKNVTAKEAEVAAASAKKTGVTETKAVPAVKVEKLTDAESETALSEAEKAKGSELSAEEEALALETAQNKKNAKSGHKPTRSVQDRINKALRRQSAAEARTSSLETENAALRAQLASGNKGPLTADTKPVKDEVAAAPDPKKFEYGELDAGYIRALARWEAKQEIADSSKNQAKEQQTADERKAAKEFKAALTSFKDKGSELYEDFEEVVFQGAKDEVWQLSDELGAALVSSDFGQQIAYELASDPKEADRVYKLSPARQLTWLGRQEAKLEETAGSGAKTEAEKAAESEATARKQAGSSSVRETKAPNPVQRARGTGSNSSVAGDTQDFAAFEAQWRAQNKR